MDTEPELSVDERGLHEAAHAVAAIESKMLGITVCLVHRRSQRGIPTDADITYSCPVLDQEPSWGALQRRLFVILAGPAWEAFTGVTDRTCQTALKKQRDDRLAALNIVRRLVRSGLQGDDLKRVVSETWQAVSELITRSNQQIVAISTELENLDQLNDSQIRLIYAQTSSGAV
jgi:hypothetical protein